MIRCSLTNLPDGSRRRDGHEKGAELNRVAQLRAVLDDQDRSPTPDSVHEVVGERKFDMMAGCRSVFEYEQLNKIDEGTYGVVFLSAPRRRA